MYIESRNRCDSNFDSNKKRVGIAMFSKKKNITEFLTPILLVNLQVKFNYGSYY